jgi:hypothetical protein
MKALIFNPFEKISEKKLLLIGITSMLVGATLGYLFNARYDGVFDLHFEKNTSYFNALLDILISVSTTCILLLAVGKYTNSKTRLIDIFNACSMAKIPFYVLTLFNINNWIYYSSEKLVESLQHNLMKMPSLSEFVPVLLFSMLTILGLVLSALLLFNGYKVATNAKGTKSIGLFVVALFLAEIFSKIIISYLN